jgi:hemerythrin-like domain-containing protein
MQISAPLADFDHPLDMLNACHDRIEDRLRVLERLVDHVGAGGVDEEARQAAANVMRYFDTAGEHHHEDEEQNLFPALRKRAAQDEALMALLDRLAADHESMRAAWVLLRARLCELTDGDPAALDRELVGWFNALYRSHILLEERELLPAAERLLEPLDQARLGEAMAHRRGVSVETAGGE